MAFRFLLPALVLLMIDAIIEVGFIGSMVGYLHQAHGDVPFQIYGAQGSTFELYPKPAHPIVNQGHTSNGAAGTAFVLVGIVGLFVLWQQGRRDQTRSTSGSSRIFLTWTVFTILSFLLTLSALIYTFVVTNQTDDQTISISVAEANSRKPYPDDEWTPENWYKQVLTLPFVDESQKSGIRMHVNLMSGWRWNLIPLLLLGLSVSGLAVFTAIKERRVGRNTGGLEK